MTYPTIQLRRLTRLRYGDALPDHERQAGEVPVYASGGQVGLHRQANTRRQAIIVGRKGSYGSVWFSESPAYVIDTAYVIDDYLRPTLPRWLYYVLLASDLRSLSQDVGVPGLSRHRAHGLRVPDCDLATQHRVAGFLDQECERIAALDFTCQRLVAVAAGSLESWFEGQPELGNADSCSLSRVLASLSDGPFGSALASEHYVDAEAVRVIRLGNIGRAEFREEDRAFVSDKYGRELREFALEPGDVIIAGLGDENHPLGRACVVPGSVLPAIHKADCFRAVVRPEHLLADYLAWALSFGRVVRENALLARGSTRSRLNTGLVKSIRLPLPALRQQAELVQRAEAERISVRRLSHRVEVLTARLDEYRDALITEAVTGQLDVSGVSDAQMDERAHAAMEGEPLEAVR